MAAAAYDTNTPTDNTSFIDEGKRSHLGSGSSPTRRAWPSTSARHSDMSAAADATRYQFATCSKGAANSNYIRAPSRRPPPLARPSLSTAPSASAWPEEWARKIICAPDGKNDLSLFPRIFPSDAEKICVFVVVNLLRLHHRWIRYALVGVALLAVIAVGGSTALSTARPGRKTRYHCWTFAKWQLELVDAPIAPPSLRKQDPWEAADDSTAESGSTPPKHAKVTLEASPRKTRRSKDSRWEL
ncbi:hypothetical protein FB451DRAFT_1399378 [Mycena latifolia]|nr:hypothetical protein FB451DRAFT_1399378 [Mycena latifolia]